MGACPGIGDAIGDFDLSSLAFDQYQRYRCVVDVLALLPLDEPALVLDVGGHSRLPPDRDFPLLPPFLPNGRVVVLDLPFCRLANYVQGSGLSLPFADGAFPGVVSVDTLEHIRPGDRAIFVDEMMRVAEQYIILAAPFANAWTAAAERIVYDYSAAVLGTGHPQIGEHLALGLPDLANWRQHLADRGWAWVELANGYLPRWLPMMLLRHYLLALPGGAELCPQVDRLYTEAYYPADQRPPAYRQVLVASRSMAFLERVRLKHVEATVAESQADSFEPLMMAPVWGELARLVRQRELEIVALGERVAAFERGRFIRFMGRLDRLKRRLRRFVRKREQI